MGASSLNIIVCIIIITSVEPKIVSILTPTKVVPRSLYQRPETQKQ